MGDRSTSPASSSSSAAANRRHSAAEQGCSCESCTAGVIADCVAVCCCPCAVLNILTLAFVKLPWSVARRCLGRRRMKLRRRVAEEGGGGEKDGTSEIVVNVGEQVNEQQFRWEEMWVELYELGYLGFGRVSFTGIPFQGKGD